MNLDEGLCFGFIEHYIDFDFSYIAFISLRCVFPISNFSMILLWGTLNIVKAPLVNDWDAHAISVFIYVTFILYLSSLFFTVDFKTWSLPCFFE